MTAVMDDYRVARQAQDARYENFTGLSVTETGRQEYRDYFGIGDCAGTAVEQRVTPRAAMVDGAAEREPQQCVTVDEAFHCTGAQLALLALAGDYVAKDEIVRRWIKRTGVTA